ncbi:MAG: MerR family transcriptional regulator [Sphingobium sp.]|nr:MerR family transcriptional regulator [Sphingobium sp.]
MDKADGAFLTIGELAEELGVAQHILRYWESRFPQLKPLQRSGNRRYYRPGDVLVARRINQLLNEQGFTVRGARRVLDGKGEPEPAPPLAPQPAAQAFAGDRSAQAELAFGGERRPAPGSASQIGGPDIALLIARLTVIRENLKEAIDAD